MVSFLDEELTGILAAIASPLCMAIGFIVWDKTWKGSSAFSLNLFKCNFASIIFVVVGLIFGFLFEKDDFSLEHIGWLILSGVLGIIVGDWLWLEALQRLGAFQVLVIDTIKPFCAAVMGRFLLDEGTIHPISYAAMALTMTGVLVVSLEQNKLASSVDNEPIDDNSDETKTDGHETTRTIPPSSTMDVPAADAMQDENRNDEEDGINGTGSALKSNQGDNQDDRIVGISPVAVEENQTTSFRKVGYILAVMNVLLDTYGSLLTKQHGWNFTTWGINLIRFGCSGVLMAIVSVSLALYQRPSKNDSDQEPKKEAWFKLPSKTIRMWAQVCLGVVFVTFLCPALSNYALFQIPLAYALTLTSITPLYAAFFEWTFWGQSKRPTFRALLGSSMAVGGVVWLGILNAQVNEE
ncbi:unnamed protein product [Cylindrotheca closterium]|uniref:EamA domain-containing protein n=1 Tax=Cylindrotheca closterium TaxID=2856 RepID=A0AAD2CDL8_9STRA|nr:unnamed protein product [Cylindrotheca closterium]